MKLIDKDAVVAEIEKRIKALIDKKKKLHINAWNWSIDTEIKDYKSILSLIDTLEVKEVKENKLPNPRFPHLDNIVGKVFGAGNLESFEYDEAEQLVLLAKEELLKDLEVKELDLEKETKKWWKEHLHLDPKNQLWMDAHQSIVFAKHFFELGLSVNNPITAADRGTAEEIIINLKRVEQDYRINLTKEIGWVRNKVQKGD